MKRNPDTEKELKAISPAVAAISNENVFQAPPGYFEDLPDKILSLVKTAIIQDGLSAREEIEQLSPLIAALKNKQAQTVPPDYFSTLSHIITAKLGPTKKEVPVIRMDTGRKKKWLRYAAAALITGIIGTGALFLLNNDHSSQIAMNKDIPSISALLPAVPDAELAAYLITAAPETSEWVLDNDDAGAEDIALLKMDDAYLRNELKDISDEVLRSYEEDLPGNTSL